jgi:hypothetical protein
MPRLLYFEAKENRAIKHKRIKSRNWQRFTLKSRRDVRRVLYKET